MYGAIIYVLSYMFNRRYTGKSLLEVCLFVGVSNSLWIIFPVAGIYACVCMLRDGTMDVFRGPVEVEAEQEGILPKEIWNLIQILRGY